MKRYICSKFKYTAFIMASREEIFTAKILINNEEVVNKLKKMEQERNYSAITT